MPQPANKQRMSNKEVAQEWVEQHKVSDMLTAVLGGDTQKLVQLAADIGHESCKTGLTTNQIRNIFKIVKEWEMKYLRGETESSGLKRELTMILPKLVYAASRHDEIGTWIFALTMQRCVEQITNSRDILQGFRIFTNLFEAILAYHKEAEADSRKRRQVGGRAK